VNQSNDLDAHASKADTANQTQGAGGGGVNVFFTQDSTGVSTIESNQREHQDLHAEQIGSLSQTQIDPMWADPDQGSNPADKYKLNQTSEQHASDPDFQDGQQYAECHTSGNCTANQKIQQNGQQQSNSCSGSNCDINNTFDTTSEGSGGQTCTANPEAETTCSDGEGTPLPPPTPPGD
jgi:hypothetical protein